MNYDIQIQKGGVLVLKEWDSVAKDWIEQPIEPEDYVMYLRANVCFDPTLTLRDFFLFLAKNPELFIVVSGCFFLDELIDEALMEAGEIGDIVLLRLKRMAFFDGKEINLYLDFAGISGADEFSMEFATLNSIAPLPLNLDESLIIKDLEDKTILKSRMAFSLLDVINGIVDELSLMGPAEVKALAFEAMNEQAGLSIEELRKKVEEQGKDGLIVCRLCGKDARAQCFGKPRDICQDCFENIKEN